MFAGASLLLHVGWYTLLQSGERPQPALEDQTIELTMLSEPPASAPEPLVPPEPEPAPEPELAQEPPQPQAATPPVPRRREREAPREAAPPQPVEVEAAATAPAPVPPPSAAEAPTSPQPEVATAERAPSTIDLSPRRAASTLLEQVTQDLPRACSPSSGVASAPACEPPKSDRLETAQRILNDSLQKAANAPEYRKQREPPDLQRHSDGSFTYRGPVFAARIRADGHVEFTDPGAATVDGPATIGPGMMGSFDLSNAADAMMGKERSTAEKKWFLDQTAALRERLVEVARAEEAVQARRVLSRALDQILLANGLSPAQKRKEVLQLWESCGDDAESLEARRKVEDFIRLKMPEGTALGFTRVEIDRFNADRRGMAPFDPYRRS